MQISEMQRTAAYYFPINFAFLTLGGIFKEKLLKVSTFVPLFRRRAVAAPALAVIAVMTVIAFVVFIVVVVAAVAFVLLISRTTIR